MYTIAHCGLWKPEPPTFSSRLGRGGKKREKSETASRVGGKLNLGQVQFAARLLALIIEQCHGLSLASTPPLSSPTSPVHGAPILPRIDHALGGNAATKVPH